MCQSGVVNRVQISTISQDKIAILVDGIDLVMYPNSLKFMQAGNDDSDFKVSWILRKFIGNDS